MIYYGGIDTITDPAAGMESGGGVITQPAPTPVRTPTTPTPAPRPTTGPTFPPADPGPLNASDIPAVPETIVAAPHFVTDYTPTAFVPGIGGTSTDGGGQGNTGGTHTGGTSGTSTGTPSSGATSGTGVATTYGASGTAQPITTGTAGVSPDTTLANRLIDLYGQAFPAIVSGGGVANAGGAPLVLAGTPGSIDTGAMAPSTTGTDTLIVWGIRLALVAAVGFGGWWLWKRHKRKAGA